MASDESIVDTVDSNLNMMRSLRLLLKLMMCADYSALLILEHAGRLHMLGID